MITKKRNTGRGNATRPPKVVPKVSLKGPPILVDRLQFSADGRVLVASGEALEAYGWDLASRKPVVKQSMDDALEDLEALDLDNMEFGPTLTAEGKAYAKRLKGPTGVEAVDLATGRVREPAPVHRLLSPDGRWYAGILDREGNRIAFYDARTGKPVGSAAGKAHSATSPLAFSPDGSLLAGEAGAGKVAVWSVPDGKRVCALAGHGADLAALAFSPAAKWLATAGDDECVGLWEPVGGELKGWLVGWEEQVASLAFARVAGGDVLLVADSDSLGLFAVPDLTPVARLPGKSFGAKDSEVEAAGASADGKLVAVAVGGGRVNVFDAEDLAKVGLAVPDDTVRQEMPSQGRTSSRRRG